MRGSKLERKEWLAAYFFVLPMLVVFIPFRIFPMFFNVLLSFGEWDPFTNKFSWSFLSQYQNLVQDEKFVLALRNTFLYVLGVLPTAMIIGLAVALLLNKKLPLGTFARAAFFIPYIGTLVAEAAIWRWLYDPTSGLINAVLETIGLPTSMWLTSSDTAMISVIIFNTWRLVGYTAILFLAGLQAIPSQYYEAARIDGADRFQSFFYLTLPLLKPATLFILVMCTIIVFQAFDEIYIMTGGGPGNATTVLLFYVYQQAFYFIHYSYAAAVGVFLMGLVLAISLIEMKLLRTQ